MQRIWTVALVSVALVAVACGGRDRRGVVLSDSGTRVDSGTVSDAASDSAPIDSSVDTGGSAGPLVVFTTASVYPGDDLGGPEGADSICQFHADAGGLPGRFKAYLHVGAMPGHDRIEGEGPWLNPNGELVFNNRTNLQTMPLVGLSVDENGLRLSSPLGVWTGTTGLNCNDWGVAGFEGTVGDSQEPRFWSDLTVWSCFSQEAHLYCFQAS